MSYFRSYFEKNNTIVKDSRVNTARNNNTDIYYGDGYSKFIFKVDFTDLINKLNNGDYVNDNNTRHYLRLTNTIFGDESLLPIIRGNDKKRATSFDLILFKINEFWDEGTGYDYEINTLTQDPGNNTYDLRPSNWYNSTNANSWTVDGIYKWTINGILPNDTEIIETIHFDNGNENIDVDITDYVNSVIESNITDYGLGLAFDYTFEILSPAVPESVSFFTKYTQTFFEPYVESVFQDRINDNRHNFVGNVNQNLYLYVTKGGNFYDLDYEPQVDILDTSNNVIGGLVNLQSIKIRKGVYQVTFGIDGTICDGRRFFFDNWKGLEIDGTNITDVKQKFIPRSFSAQYSIGENPTEFQRYVVQYYGVKLNEKIKRGEKRKIVVNLKSIDTSGTILFDEVYYRVFILEGRTNVIVHDWTQLDVTNENSFILDTSYMIPREYFIEIKAKTHGEEIFYNDHLKFEIISER